MSKPSNRYARAQARARYRKPKRRSSSLVWNLAIAVIVIAGVGLIVLSRTGGSSDTAPKVGDHWHAQFDAFVCGESQPVAAEFETSTDGSRVGVHTHGDGFMHIHPFTSGESGDDATVGRFLDYQGFEIGEDSFDLWFGSQSNGDPCPDGQAGVVRWSVNGEEQDGNLSDYKPQDGDKIVVAFQPEGQEMPAPADRTQTQD
ncbi:MAG TPA: hypothetical protein VF152_04940 [Acidimicrobiia bacterium]